MATVQEFVFYVHGVSSASIAGPHAEQYRSLHEGIRDAGPHADWPEVFGGAEWGWRYDDAAAGGHRLLTQAQNELSTQALELIEGQGDFTLNPTRSLVNGMRRLMLFGFSDVFYYVSSDGKASVRRSVCEQLLGFINEQREGDRNISLTLVGHSAGAMIVFDLLYYLFSQRRGHEFLSVAAEDETLRGLDALKQLRVEGKLRLRRLITLGAPISMTAYRSDALVEIFARGERLRPRDYGLESQLADEPVLGGVRWLNLWDKDDPISYPVSPIMASPHVKDIYVDVSDRVSNAHTAYWESGVVHRQLAERW